MPQVSIIMAIYNAESSLPHALESIQKQSMTDFEVILINDGSTDGSSAVCDDICSKDKRFKVVHKTNAGVGAARQTGIELAKGQYVIHVDADDWIESNMLAELYNEADIKKADIVICDYFVNLKEKQILRPQKPSSLHPHIVLRELFRQLHGSCWNKLVRKDCYVRNNARFIEGINYCEDLLFWVQLLQNKDIKICYLPKSYYHYVVSDNSITRNFTKESYIQCLKFCKYLDSLLVLPGYEDCKKKVKLSTLFMAFSHNVISNQDARRQLVKQFKRAAFIDNKSTRYRLGYFALALGFYSIAHKLLHFA